MSFIRLSLCQTKHCSDPQPPIARIDFSKDTVRLNAVRIGTNSVTLFTLYYVWHPILFFGIKRVSQF